MQNVVTSITFPCNADRHVRFRVREICESCTDVILSTGSHTWLFEPVWLAGQWHLDAPPPQSQSAVQAEHGVTVSLLIKVSIDEFISELWDIDRLTLKVWTAVLIPVLGSDSHREVDCGQQAQHGADDQSCGIAVVYHGLDGGSSFYRCLQRQAALHRK